MPDTLSAEAEELSRLRNNSSLSGEDRLAVNLGSRRKANIYIALGRIHHHKKLIDTCKAYVARGKIGETTAVTISYPDAIKHSQAEIRKLKRCIKQNQQPEPKRTLRDVLGDDDFERAMREGAE